MNVNNLKKLVGEPYQELDEAGNYVGCFAPIYFLYPDLPRYPLPERQSDYCHYAWRRLIENFIPVDVPEVLDVIVFRLAFGVLHVGIFLGGNKILHVQNGSRVEIRRIFALRHRIVAVLRKAKIPRES